MSSIERWTVTEPYLKTSCSLGEGPYYVEERNELRFLDINNSKLYIIDLNKGPASAISVDTGMPVGVTADIQGVDSSEIILTGAKDGVTKFNVKTGKHEYIAKYWKGSDAQEKSRRMRSNDGNVDSQGRFWVEAFVDPEIEEPTDEGVLFKLDQSGKLVKMHEQIEIPNGISWTEDRSTMYLTDTTVKKIWAYDYEEISGDITNKRIFFELDAEGNPDGHAIDVHGNIWHALYGGGKVIRISPDGKITGEISLPTRNITCPAFAGTDLFITTAEEEEPEKYPESAKYAGNLFRVDVGVKGPTKQKAKLPLGQ